MTYSLVRNHIACRLREETLKSLVHLVDKLDENNLQEKLVRCITNLQQDPENSIRTNATIFLGKIMPRLKEAPRWELGGWAGGWTDRWVGRL